MLDNNMERDEGIRHFERGVALERVNRMMEAVEEYRQAVARYPHLREAHAALGFYYQRNGLLAKAAEEFHVVARLEGGFLAYFNLGHVLVELERYEEALQSFQHCLNIDPEDPATHYEIGYIHYSRQEFAEALKHLHVALQIYPEDWEVLHLAGKCYLGMSDYDSSLEVFRRALLYAVTPQVQAILLDDIAMVQRYREYRTINGVKDSVYVQDGVVYLGSTQDDGLSISAVQDYHFTYPDIGTTLQRFLALQKVFQWQFTSVVAVDKVALPLAEACSQLLHLPHHRLQDLSPSDLPLLIMATNREVELLLLTVERITCDCVTFCLGVNWLRHSKVMPDITGIAAHGACSVPWEPELRRLYADGAPIEERDLCIAKATDNILQAVHNYLPEKNLARQVRYYTHRHRKLRFAPQRK